jgi:hypothetical protein
MNIGRKKSRRPPGFRRYRASTTRSAASADNLYDLVVYRGNVEQLDVIPTRVVVDEEVKKAHVRPRRFAPARTPSTESKSD